MQVGSVKPTQLFAMDEKKIGSSTLHKEIPIGTLIFYAKNDFKIDL
jgi:hypothetical protein